MVIFFLLVFHETSVPVQLHLLIGMLLQILFPYALRGIFLSCLGVQLCSICGSLLRKSGMELAPLLSASLDKDRLHVEWLRLVETLWIIYLMTFVGFLLFPSMGVVLFGWILFLSVLLYPSSTGGDYRSLVSHGARQMSYLIGGSLLRTMSPLDWRSPTGFLDILMGDVLTSYSRVMAESFSVIWLALFKQVHGSTMFGFHSCFVLSILWYLP